MRSLSFFSTMPRNPLQEFWLGAHPRAGFKELTFSTLLEVLNLFVRYNISYSYLFYHIARHPISLITSPIHQCLISALSVSNYLVEERRRRTGPRLPKGQNSLVSDYSHLGHYLPARITAPAASGRDGIKRFGFADAIFPGSIIQLVTTGAAATSDIGHGLAGEEVPFFEFRKV